MVPEDAQNRLGRYLEENRLKRTRQREIVLDALLQSGGHVSSEELYHSIREQNPSLGFTTVYRALKLLVDAGLAEERHFDDGVARYEFEHAHHDHLVCTECDRIIEFESEEIERLQNEIAKEHGFVMERHRHELYGLCAECQKV